MNTTLRLSLLGALLLFAPVGHAQLSGSGDRFLITGENLLKGAPVEELTRAIRTVHADGSYLESRVASTLLAEVRAPRRGGGRLSERERAVLRLVAAGLTSKQIARELSITERTVQFHVTGLLNKLGAESRAQAVAIAAERGLL